MCLALAAILFSDSTTNSMTPWPPSWREARRAFTLLISTAVRVKYSHIPERLAVALSVAQLVAVSSRCV